MKYACCRRENVSLKGAQHSIPGGQRTLRKRTHRTQVGYLAEVFSELPAELLSSRVFIEILPGNQRAVK